MRYSIDMFNYSDYKKQPLNKKIKLNDLYQKPIKKMYPGPNLHRMPNREIEQKDKLIEELKAEIEDLKEQIKLLEAVNQEC